jgi:hypothetical protein
MWRLIFGSLLAALFVIGGVVLAQTDGPPVAPPIPPPPPRAIVLSGSEAKTRYGIVINAAKRDMRVELRAVRVKYFKAVLADDDVYIRQLSDGLAAALQRQDLKAAEQLDQQKTAAGAARLQHFKASQAVYGAEIVKAVWASTYGNGETAVTDKLRVVISGGDRSTRVEAKVFGDQWPKYPKHLIITFKQDGVTETMVVPENDTLPAVLFSPIFHEDDPAYDPLIP